MPKRVLIVGLTENSGGIETYIMDLYRRIDRNKVQFDFLYSYNGSKHRAFESEILALGGRIFYVPMLRFGPIEHYRLLNQLFKQTHYTAVYYQANHKIKNSDVFRIAANYQVPLRMIHSHNSATMEQPIIFNRIREILAFQNAKRYITNYYSCSEAAGEWMFGKTVPFTVINNGIDTQLFDFRSDVRNRIRLRENLNNKVVFGTVARIAPPKNSLFLVDIFSEIHKLQPNSIFLHIGGNYMGKKIQEKIALLGLEDNYLLLGQQEKVFEYLNAMDLFLLPSIHEGFPISLVEAQTSGLHCLIADTITKDIALTNNITFFSLAEPAKRWAELATSLTSYQRESCRQTMIERGFDIQSRVAAFEDLILSEE